MSKETRLSRLDLKIRNKIIAILYQNGLFREDIDLLLTQGKLKDIEEYVNLSEVLC